MPSCWRCGWVPPLATNRRPGYKGGATAAAAAAAPAKGPGARTRGTSPPAQRGVAAAATTAWRVVARMRPQPTWPLKTWMGQAWWVHTLPVQTEPVRVVSVRMRPLRM